MGQVSVVMMENYGPGFSGHDGKLMGQVSVDMMEN